MTIYHGLQTLLEIVSNEHKQKFFQMSLAKNSVEVVKVFFGK